MTKLPKSVAKDENIDQTAVKTYSPLEIGSLIAAHVNVSSEVEKAQEEWILATIIGHTKDGYVIEDFEDISEGEPKVDASPVLRQFTVSKEKILILPRSVDEAITIAEALKPKDKVLALFPGTTCMYPAIVVSFPQKVHSILSPLPLFFSDEKLEI